jgi:hypothetical protein
VSSTPESRLRGDPCIGTVCHASLKPNLPGFGQRELRRGLEQAARFRDRDAEPLSRILNRRVTSRPITPPPVLVYMLTVPSAMAVNVETPFGIPISIIATAAPRHGSLLGASIFAGSSSRGIVRRTWYVSGPLVRLVTLPSHDRMALPQSGILGVRRYPAPAPTTRLWALRNRA